MSKRAELRRQWREDNREKPIKWAEWTPKRIGVAMNSAAAGEQVDVLVEDLEAFGKFVDES